MTTTARPWPGSSVPSRTTTRASPAWRTATPIMSIKIWEGSRYVNVSTLASAIYYAGGRTADGTGTWRGADVLNFSYEWPSAPVITTAFDWVSTNGRGGLGLPVFVAAGNDGDGDVCVPGFLAEHDRRGGQHGWRRAGQLQQLWFAVGLPGPQSRRGGQNRHHRSHGHGGIQQRRLRGPAEPQLHRLLWRHVRRGARGGGRGGPDVVGRSVADRRRNPADHAGYVGQDRRRHVCQRIPFGIRLRPHQRGPSRAGGGGQ